MLKIGQRLQGIRIKKGLSVDEIAKEIKIKPQFLTAIEKGEYEKLPSIAYAQGFVRNYADYLGLPKSETTALFKRDFDENKNLKVLPDGLSGNTEGFHVSWARIRQIFLGLILVLIVLGFVVFQYRSFFFAPSLSITSPKDEMVEAGDIKVAGITDSAATVLINGEQVSVAEDGKFVKGVTLFPGTAEIVVKSTNRLGKQTTITKRIKVKE